MPSRTITAPRNVRSGTLHWVATLAETQHDPRARFMGVHLWVPLLIFAAAIIAIDISHLDWRIAHALYSWEGYRWLLKRDFITETVIHKLGRNLSILAWLSVLCAWAATYRRPALAAWRTPLAYLALSIVLSTLLVSWTKSWTNMDCPWDMIGLGGSRPYIKLYEARPDYLPHNACFPAGHASGGYAWMSLYFFFLMARPGWRWYGLGIGSLVGLIFGIGQQLRGAHFLSHDLWTAAICWASALALYLLFSARVKRRAYELRWKTPIID
jgi:membrane-associated PAP2 superfamily phosphatase